MPQINGIDLLKMLDYKPKIIMTTAYKEFAYEGFELNVSDYLLKPISFETFVKSVNKIIGKIDNTSIKDNTSQLDEAKYTFIKTDHHMHKVFLDDILFIEGLKDRLQIVTKTGNINAYFSLKYMEAKLPQRYFFRVHRSFIVNYNNISSFNSSELIVNKIIIPIGRHYKKSVNDFIEQKKDIF